MDRETIRGYAIAAKVLDERLRGKVSGERLDSLFDRYCDDPRKVLPEYVRLAVANGVARKAESEVADALELVNPEESGPLTIEEQGDLILDWYKARERPEDGATVGDAVRALGVSRQRVIALINQGQLKATKPHGRWIIDRDSLSELAKARASRS